MRQKESHEARTAKEPRDMTLHDVVVSRISPVGRLVRVFELRIPDGQPDICFQPGQWVDLFVPGVAKAGGFTITSTPAQACAAPGRRERWIELAVKQSPDNPPAAWLWQTPEGILGQTLRVRTGGSFVLPPRGVGVQAMRRVVFVAGGVGINPLISMASVLGAEDESEADTKPEAVFLYTARDDENDDNTNERILFLRRLAGLFGSGSVRGQLKLFLTDGQDSGHDRGCHDDCTVEGVPSVRRRITTADVDEAVGTDPAGVYVYVCGVPSMTDTLVAHLTDTPERGGLGLSEAQVLFERWW